MNDTKLCVIVSGQVVFKKRIFLRIKHMGYCMSVWGTMVTSTVLAATYYRGFYVIVITLTPLTFKRNMFLAYLFYVSRA